MKTANRVVWQQAAGDTDRDYAEICMRWGVILNGPGGEGAWPLCEEPLRRQNCSSRKLTDLRRFAEEMKSGDIVVLRRGTAHVLAVGEIVGDYSHHEQFGDVDGWTLQHVRRVRWLWSGLQQPKKFAKWALKQGDTTQRLNQGAVLDWLKDLVITPESYSAALPDLPPSTANEKLTVDEISEFLFDQGVASASISSLLAEIGELIRIAKWYQRPLVTADHDVSIHQEVALSPKSVIYSYPSEHETVTYLVVPLLRALGWTPQRMAVEWKHVDVALFDQLPRDDKNLQVVVEAKKMDNSCLSAKSQAMAYAEGKRGCHRLIVTDGLRYGVFTRIGAEEFKLYAYLNLTNLKRHYPVLECFGAEQALLSMAPEWRLEKMQGVAP